MRDAEMKMMMMMMNGTYREGKDEVKRGVKTRGEVKLRLTEK